MDLADITRRDFLYEAAAAGLVISLGAVKARAQDGEEVDEDELEYPDTGVGVIGCGAHGRTLLGALSHIPFAKVKGIADTSQTVFRRAGELAPEAKQHTDYRALLDDAEVSAVFIATPTHQHKQVVLDALAAGKHVYCESPLSNDLAEAREIAKAGASATTKFCVGQQLRAYPLYPHCRTFVTTGTLDRALVCRAQHRFRDNWRRPAGTPEREKELNWRLYQETSLGLVGEVGIHPIDYLCWSLSKEGLKPTRVTGWGAKLAWPDDDRTVADTVQVTYELPGGARVGFDATLGATFGGDQVVMNGTAGTIIMRGPRAWLVKEADAPQMGWEIYAHKYDLMGELGIIMVAKATKLLQDGLTPGEHAERDIQAGRDEWYYTCETFLRRIHNGVPQACGAADGYAAAVMAAKGNEAVVTGQPVDIAPDLFELG